MAIPTLTHHPRLQRARRLGHEGVQRVVSGAYALARRTPMPREVRDRLRDSVAWQPRLEVVPIDRLLLGGQNRVSAADYARGSGDLLWPSRRVAEGPHVALLERAAGHDLTDAEILSTAYAEMARHCIALSGQYFSATDDAGIVEVARDWIEVGHGRVHHGNAAGERKPHQSQWGAPVEVAPIHDSDCYQVIDGHHRVAALAAAGVPRMAVRVHRVGVRTPLQELLRSMSWIGGQCELYQPVSAPEVATWPVVRGCVDRLAKITALLEERGLTDEEPETYSYLDVASCYGWFVAEMGLAGFRAEGIERDPLAPQLGSLVQGISPDQITSGDAVDFLGAADRTWDVVSCFSLLHHFVLGRGSVSAAELLHRLDKVTGSVLFLDTGQSHETWFAESLAEWDTTRIRQFLLAETSFDRVIDLGPDEDDRPPYSGNYGRHLFACVRER